MGRPEQLTLDFERGSCGVEERPAAKRCPRCGQTKPATEYFRNSQRRDGLFWICADCDRKRLGRKGPQKPSGGRLVGEGERFGRLVATGPCVERKVGGRTRVYIPCRCDCGQTRLLAWKNLEAGKVRSCGCLHREELGRRSRTHGATHTKLYGIWSGMKRRCNSPTDQAYGNYGARGIKVCPEWAADFAVFQAWANANGYRDGLTIEREDVDGDYRPDNCKWIARSDQNNNRRDTWKVTAFGETRTLAAWSRDARCSVHCTSIKRRLMQGWEPEKAIATPQARVRPAAVDPAELYRLVRIERTTYAEVKARFGLSRNLASRLVRQHEAVLAAAR